MKNIINEVDIPHYISGEHKQDNLLFEKFIEEYDSQKDLKFQDLQYRPGAAFSAQFGLAEGFRVDENSELNWGYVRVHVGVDRYGAKDGDAVIAPFNFSKSKIVDFGDVQYGTLISLFNIRYSFEFRIAHMDPEKNILPDVLERLKGGFSISRNTKLGSAGNYGYSSGAHTHTEVKSFKEANEVFDRLLYEKYKNDSLEEYKKEEIYEEFLKRKNYEDASLETILKDYNDLREQKRVIFFNKYKCKYVDYDNTIKTRYSTYHLFNRL